MSGIALSVADTESMLDTPDVDDDFTPTSVESPRKSPIHADTPKMVSAVKNAAGDSSLNIF